MITRERAFVWNGSGPYCYRSNFHDAETGKKWVVEVICQTRGEAEEALDFILGTLNDGIALAKLIEARSGK